MKSKIFAWVYGLASIAAIFNAWLAFRHGNNDATIAWMCASGMALGACSELIEKINNEKDEDSVS
jgi:hypothetical protein